MRSSRIVSLTVLLAGLALWTLAPYGGCSCYNPLGSNSGPTPIPTATHGPVVATFADAQVGVSAATYNNHWRGDSLESVDALGVSTFNISDFVAGGYGGLPALELHGTYGYGAVSHACIGGVPPSTYPFVAFRMYLNPLDGAGDEDVTVSTAPPAAVGLRFWAYQTAAPANTLRVKCILKVLADYANANQCAANAYAYHLKDLPSVAGVWTQYSIPFNQFIFPSWATGTIMGVNYAASGQDLTKPVCLDGGGHLRLMAIQFEPLNPTTYPASAPYDFFIDNVEFY